MYEQQRDGQGGIPAPTSREGGHWRWTLLSGIAGALLSGALFGGFSVVSAQLEPSAQLIHACHSGGSSGGVLGIGSSSPTFRIVSGSRDCGRGETYVSWNQAGPRGLQGAPGVAGERGAQGPQGDRGVDGIAGPVGPKGERGADGAVGPAGAQGERGADGAAGPAGPRGAVGPAGPAGDVGAQGAAGQQGERGADGPPGMRGPEGRMGPAGPQGPTGPRGPEGPPGARGSDGHGLTCDNERAIKRAIPEYALRWECNQEPLY